MGLKNSYAKDNQTSLPFPIIRHLWVKQEIKRRFSCFIDKREWILCIIWALETDWDLSILLKTCVACHSTYQAVGYLSENNSYIHPFRILAVELRASPTQMRHKLGPTELRHCCQLLKIREDRCYLGNYGFAVFSFFIVSRIQSWIS